MLLGCIGDDFTGSTDMANTLAKQGMRVTQYCGIPDTPVADDVEAGVVALKLRTITSEEAVRQSLRALAWLRDQGCRQIFFKYCSTFDSTPEGNIGPVIDALLAELDCPAAIVCPAFPATGRSVYQGHLFVHDHLLSESGMENHPLTPMRDPDIRRWLASQTRHEVGHVPATTVFAGAEAISSALDAEADAGRRAIVVDAIRDEDLMAIGTACRSHQLVTGGSGVAMGLPRNFLPNRTMSATSPAWRGAAGPGAVLSGSCSTMTRTQVERYRADHPAMEIVPAKVMAGEQTPVSVVAFVTEQKNPALVYSSADSTIVKEVQHAFGSEPVTEALERFFAETARRLVAAGIVRLVVAGGETSGAVVEGLGVEALDIGPEIVPGVPAVKAAGRALVLALKSGNFGEADFFESALEVLKGGTP